MPLRLVFEQKACKHCFSRGDALGGMHDQFGVHLGRGDHGARCHDLRSGAALKCQHPPEGEPKTMNKGDHSQRCYRTP